MQEKPAMPRELIAFRVDDETVVATVKVLDIPEARQVTSGLSAPPPARFGYQYFEPPASWRSRLPPDLPPGDRWRIHTGPGQAFDATAERTVGGNAQCLEAVGVLLRIAPDQARAFASQSAKYFIAEQTTPETRQLNTRSGVGPIVPAPLTAELRREMESQLNALFARELPRVRADAAGNLSRMAASSNRYSQSWARERLRIEDGLARGLGALAYDVQAFNLGPDGVPLYFVRAKWFVERRLGFAAAVWFKGDPKLEIVQADLQPARWLRMSLFQGRLATEQLGLILNVFDRDGDGWAEVLFVHVGYEGFGVELLEYAPSGFEPTGASYSAGC